MNYRKSKCAFAKGSWHIGPLMLCLLLNLVKRSYGQTGTSIALSQNEITATVNRFNAIRSSVNPPASNMNSLVRENNCFLCKSL